MCLGWRHRHVVLDRAAAPDGGRGEYGHPAARRRPADQKARRREAIARAAYTATAAPLAAGRDLLSGLELAEQAAQLAHRSIVSDVGAGAHLLSAALQATLLNVDINLGSLPPEAREAAQVERSEQARRGLILAQQVTQTVSGRLAG